MKELIDQYRQTLRTVRAAHKRSKLVRDKILLTEMMYDLMWTINYMQDHYGNGKKTANRTEQRLLKKVRDVEEELIAKGIAPEDARIIAAEWVVSHSRSVYY